MDSTRAASPRHEKGGSLDTRAAKWRRWLRRHLSGNGQCYEALGLLGYPVDHPLRAMERRAIEDLLVVNDDSAYCQPCVSPVWDTAWACIALQQVANERSHKAVKKAFHWLAEKQLLEESQDWQL